MSGKKGSSNSTSNSSGGEGASFPAAASVSVTPDASRCLHAPDQDLTGADPKGQAKASEKGEEKVGARFTPAGLIYRSWEAVQLLATTTPKALGLVWNAHPRYCTGLLLVIILQSFQPLASAWLTKGVIDLLALALTNHSINQVSQVSQLNGVSGSGVNLVSATATTPAATALENSPGALLTNPARGLSAASASASTGWPVNNLAGLNLTVPGLDGDLVSQLLWLLLLLGLLNLAGQWLSVTAQFIQTELGEHLSLKVNNLLLTKANSFVDLTYFENPHFYNRLQQAQSEASHKPLNMLQAVALGLRSAVSLVAVVGLLLALQPLLVGLLLLLSLPALLVQFRQQRQNWAIRNTQVSEVRQMHYFSGLLTGQEAAKEIRLFGLGQHFLGRYQALFHQFRERLGKLRKAHWRYNSLLSLGAGLAALIGYSYLVLLTLSRQLSLGQLTFYQNLLGQFHNSLSVVISQGAALYEGSLFVSQLFDFLALAPVMAVLPAGVGRLPPVPLRQGITFCNVEFGYSHPLDLSAPGANGGSGNRSGRAGMKDYQMGASTTNESEDENGKRPGQEREPITKPEEVELVLKGVSFSIEAGQTVAVVGENGSGKSTLVKLLTRLDDPSGGVIEVDGVDLREYDLDHWRAQIGVVLQDFNRYHLSVRENIGLGQLTQLEEVEQVHRAAAQGGALGLIARLPQGLETLLGRFLSLSHSAGPATGVMMTKAPSARKGPQSGRIESGGSELSGGEWQKIALSRAFMRAGSAAAPVETAEAEEEGEKGVAQQEEEKTKEAAGLITPTDSAQILILDEPSAALDARSEAGLFERLWELSRGKTTLLISHRLSTLKRADKIIVLKAGKVIEQGTHPELLALGGEYARLYYLQAEAYHA